MRTNQYLSIALASLILGFASCSKDNSSMSLPRGIEVVHTTFGQSYHANSGIIVVSEEGFEVSTDAPWLHAQKEGAKTITLTIDKNESAESRTANVIIQKGDNVQRVPITQLGVVNIMKLNNIEAQRQGGEYTFSTENMDTAPIVSTDANWVSYVLENNTLKIGVAPFPAGETKDRTATINVKAGLFERTISVTQTYGVVAYSDLVGQYEVEYMIEHGKRAKGVVTLEAKEANKSFTLKGFTADLTLNFDAKTGRLTLFTGAVPSVTDLAANESVVLVGWGAAVPNPKNENKPDYNFNYNNPGHFTTGLGGEWNKDFQNIGYKFTTFGFGNDNRPVVALCVLLNGNWNRWYQSPGKISHMGDATWTKIK